MGFFKYSMSMRKKIISALILSNRYQKSSFKILCDLLILISTVWTAYVLDFGAIYPFTFSNYGIFLSSVLIAIPVFIIFDLYKSIIRFIGFKEIWVIVKAVTIYSFLWGLVVSYFYPEESNLTVFFMHWLLVLVLIVSSRMIAVWIFSDIPSASNVIIYGAGSAGLQLATALRVSREMNPIGFIDGDKSLQGSYLSGLEVYQPSQLGKVVRRKSVQEVLIAIPSARKAILQDIFSSVEELPVKVRIIPGVAELAQGKVSIADLKVLEVTDLLGREIEKPDVDLLMKNIHKKNVLVTGAGGSIGSELSRQVLKEKPKTLVLYEISEFALYKIEKELEKSSSDTDIKPILGNVMDKSRLKEVCRTFNINTIYHAAAYKHVPMVEMNTVQSIENNIFGTLSCTEVAINEGVETFVLVSTDKAVRPTNVMGATKRFSEMILQALAEDQRLKESKKKTRIVIVRFGNVLDSSGSAVPLFREQIENGGPITVTDPKVIRYFMSIPEAAGLVVQAGAMGKGGDVFVLDMGEPIKIVDLAKRMIRLSGLEVRDKENPEGDIEIVFTGLREGEKLFEELLIGNNISSTNHKGIMRAEEEYLPLLRIEDLLGDLRKGVELRDQDALIKILTENISGFELKSGMNDLIYLSKLKDK